MNVSSTLCYFPFQIRTSHWTRSIEQDNTDAEKLKKEVINVFTQTDFDNSVVTEVSPKQIFLAPHGFSSSPENFSHNSATYSSLKLDADHELSAKIDT